MQKNFIYLVIGQIIISAVGLFSTAVWARYSSLEQFGAVQLALSFLAFASSLSFPGFKYAAQISSAKNKHGNLLIILHQKIKYAVLGLMVLLIIAIYQFLRPIADVFHLTIFVIIFFLPIVLSEAITGWLNGRDAIKTIVGMEVSIKVIGAVLVSLTLVFTQNIALAFFLLLLSNALLIVFVLQQCLKKLNNDSEDRNLINYGKKMSWPMLIAALLSLDKFVISEYLTLAEVSIYTVAFIFASYPKQLYKILSRLMISKISAAKNISDAWENTQKYIIIASSISTLIGIFGYYLVDDIIQFIFTKKYVRAIEIARWFWLMGCLSIPATFLADILRAQKILNFTRVFEPSNSILRFTLLIALIPFFGLWGALLSTITLQVLSSIFFVTYFLRELKKAKT